MTTQGEQTNRGPEKNVKQEAAQEAPVTDGALVDQAAGFEGQVNETAKTSASEDGGAGGGTQDDGAAQQAKDDKVKADKSALKAKLLKNAPTEPKMR